MKDWFCSDVRDSWSGGVPPTWVTPASLGPSLSKASLTLSSRLIGPGDTWFKLRIRKRTSVNPASAPSPSLATTRHPPPYSFSWPEQGDRWSSIHPKGGSQGVLEPSLSWEILRLMGRPTDPKGAYRRQVLQNEIFLLILENANKGVCTLEMCPGFTQNM